MLASDNRDLFLLAPEVIYVNHGGFGATPRSVLDQKKKILEQIEKNPTDFLVHQFSQRWHRIANIIAQRFSLAPVNLAIVDNATDGIEAVLRALSLEPGDEILTTSMSYGAVTMAARHIAERQGAQIRIAELRFPEPDADQCIAAVAQAITPRTKLAVLDHITSATALVMPVGDMIAVCHERDVAVLIDGAHAPGQVALDIPALKPDWYVGNLHKWYFVPRGCGFLWAAPGKEDGLMPNVLSWEITRSFPSNFAWTGTRDPSSWLAVPAAFDFMDQFGENDVRQHNHSMVRDAVAILAEMWRFHPTAPENMMAAMVLVPAPPGLPYPATDEGRMRLERDLKEKYSVIVNPTFACDGRIWLRITAQIYNSIDDYQKLGVSVLALR